MTVLFLKTPPALHTRLLVSLPGTPDELRAAAAEVGGSLGALGLVLLELERNHALSLPNLRASMDELLERVLLYRRAQRQSSREPYDPEDPRRPLNDGGRNLRAWFLFTHGDQLATDLRCLLDHLARLAEIGVEEVTISGWP